MENTLIKHHERCIWLLEQIQNCNYYIETYKERINKNQGTQSWNHQVINNWLRVRSRLWDWHKERLEKINKIIQS